MSRPYLRGIDLKGMHQRGEFVAFGPATCVKMHTKYIKIHQNTSLHHRYKRSDEPACIAQSCTVCPDVGSRSREGTESDPGRAPFTPTLIGTGRHQ